MKVKCPRCSRILTARDGEPDVLCNCHQYCEDGDKPSDCDLIDAAFIEDVGTFCLSFDGTNDVATVADTADLNFTNEDVSCEAWVYLDQFLTESSFVFDKFSSVTGHLWYIQPDGSMAFRTVQAGPASQNTISYAVIKPKTWHHICATRSGAVVKTYIDGVDQTNTSAAHVDPDLDSDPLGIGAKYTGTRYWLDGYIDEIRFYKGRALSAAEVALNYNNGVGRYTPYNQANLVLWLHCDTGEGTVAYDSSGNRYDATLTGATWNRSRPLDEWNGNFNWPAGLHTGLGGKWDDTQARVKWCTTHEKYTDKVPFLVECDWSRWYLKRAPRKMRMSHGQY